MMRGMVEDAAEIDSKKSLPLWLVMLISYGIFSSAIVIDQALRWTDHWNGMFNGLFHALLCILPWCMILLPLSLMLAKVSNHHRTLLGLLPSSCVLFLVMLGLILGPPSAQGYFRSTTGHHLPENIKNVRFHCMGGGIADQYAEIYFETTPREVDRLIDELGLKPQPGFVEDEITLMNPRQVFHDFRSWPKAKKYQKHESFSYIYDLITDETKTKVIVKLSGL